MTPIDRNVNLWDVVVAQFGALRPEGHMFESNSSRYVGILGKSFTHSCLKRFGVLTPTQN